MKLLVDMNLSPRWIALLRNSGVVMGSDTNYRVQFDPHQMQPSLLLKSYFNCLNQPL